MRTVLAVLAADARGALASGLVSRAASAVEADSLAADESCAELSVVIVDVALITEAVRV